MFAPPRLRPPLAVIVLGALSACAAGGGSAAAPQAAVSVPPANGTVASIRLAAPPAGGAVDRIMAALGEPPDAAPPTIEQIVIRMPDNTVKVVVQPMSNGGGLQPGEHVAVTGSSDVSIRPD